MAKSITTFRLEPKLIEDIDALVTRKGLKRGRWVEGILQAAADYPEALRVLQAYRERRVAIFSVPAPVAPNDGSDPANPVHVCLNPE